MTDEKFNQYQERLRKSIDDTRELKQMIDRNTAEVMFKGGEEPKKPIYGPPADDKPAVGRIVHYVGDKHLAAIICEVLGDRYVNLCVFHPNGAPVPIAKVGYEPSGVIRGTWHWPEIE